MKQLYRSLFDLGLLDACDFPALVRYARGGGKQPEPSRELRPKNAYNLLRLILVATGWLESGRPEFEMMGAARDRLLEIKRGSVDLDEVLAEAERLVPRLEAARDATRLPPRPDLARADALLRRIGEDEHAPRDRPPEGPGRLPEPLALEHRGECALNDVIQQCLCRSLGHAVPSASRFESSSADIATRRSW